MYTKNSVYRAFFHIRICPGVHASVVWIYVTSHSHMALIYGMSSSLFNNSLLGDVTMYSVTMHSISWNNLLVFVTSVLLAEMPGTGIAGSKGECACGFARPRLIPFQEGCAILHSPCSWYECLFPTNLSSRAHC